MKTNNTPEQSAVSALVTTKKHWTQKVRELEIPEIRERINQHWRYLPEPDLARCLQKAGKLFTVQILLLPELAKRVPTEIRSGAAHHTDRTIRKLVALNSGFPRTERMAALIGNQRPSCIQQTGQWDNMVDELYYPSLRGLVISETRKPINWGELAPFTEQEATELLQLSWPVSETEMYVPYKEWAPSAIVPTYLTWAAQTQNPAVSGLTNPQIHRVMTKAVKELIPELRDLRTNHRSPVKIKAQSWLQAVFRSYALTDKHGDLIPFGVLSEWMWSREHHKVLRRQLVTFENGHPLRAVNVQVPKSTNWDLYQFVLETILHNFGPGQLTGHIRTPENQRMSADRFVEPIPSVEARFVKQFLQKMSAGRATRFYPSVLKRYWKNNPQNESIRFEFLDSIHFSNCVNSLELIAALRQPPPRKGLLRVLQEGLEHGCYNHRTSHTNLIMERTGHVQGRLAVLQNHLSGQWLLNAGTPEIERFLRTRYPDMDREAAQVMADTNPEYSLRDITVTLGH